MDVQITELHNLPQARMLSKSRSQSISRPSLRNDSKLSYQPFQSKVEEIKPHSIEFNQARFQYLKVITTEETVCFGISMNLTKVLYKLMCGSNHWLIIALINTLFSQIIRVYLAIDLVQIIFSNNQTADNWLLLIIFLSRFLYFLTILRAGLVQSQLGSLQIVIKCYMRNAIQSEEDELFFQITTQDILRSIRAAILPAGWSILALPKHNRPEMLRIYILLNFIQESLDAIFFLPVYVVLFILYAVDEKFGINFLIPAGSLYITFFELLRVVTMNIVLIIKSI